MSDQKQKIEMEALRVLFLSEGIEMGDDLLKALLSWPGHTEVDRAINSLVEISVKFACNEYRHLFVTAILNQVLSRSLKFPAGGIIAGRGPNGEHIQSEYRIIPDCEKLIPKHEDEGGEYLINPKRMRPFAWADSPPTQFEPKAEIEEIWFDEVTELEPKAKAYFTKERLLSEIPRILFEPKIEAFQNNITGFVKLGDQSEGATDYGDAAWKVLCETLNNRDHGKEGTEEDISIQGEEEERPAGPGHVCDMDEPPE